jgi:hypothetical protein
LITVEHGLVDTVRGKSEAEFKAVELSSMAT